MMKACVYTEYGSPDVLHLKEVEKPVPNDDEILVKVHAASVNAADWHLLTADIFLVRLMTGGLFAPKNTILGFDIAGEVEAVGRNVQAFQPHDAVFGSGVGGFAEYVALSENAAVHKPANVSFEEAAAVPIAGTTALQGLRDKGQVQAGQQVLIQGSGGGVGTFAVQIAKAFGAEVTAVCSARNADIMRSIGADHVIDYAQQDFTRSGQRYDLILAANGYHSIFAYRSALNPGGRYIMAGGQAAQMFEAMLLGPWISMTGSRKMGSVAATTTKHDLVSLGELLQSGKVRPIIDRRYPLSEAAEALRYLGEGHARGKVIITVA
jgi:NADPH:quinone reductase-like Zn-dependent oxidoreductase